MNFVLIGTKPNCLISMKLIDQEKGESFFSWSFGRNTDCAEFGLKYSIAMIREKINMKHLVKVQVVVETEETDLRKIATLGLEEIIKKVNDEFVVVDVYRNCIGVELICIQNKDMIKGVETNDKKRKN